MRQDRGKRLIQALRFLNVFRGNRCQFTFIGGQSQYCGLNVFNYFYMVA